MTKALLLSLLLSPAPVSAARPAETVAVVSSGEALAPAPSYSAGGKLYLDARRVGEIYGGQTYFYPVSGRVQLTLRGRSARFLVDSDKATLGEEGVALEAPVITRVSRAFLPVSLLLSKEFARWSGVDARWESSTRTLELDRRATVGPVRAFSYKDRTRLAVPLAEDAAYQARAAGTKGVEVTAPFGIVEADEKVEMDDGVVASYSVRQEARAARVSVRLAEAGLRWKAFELKQPRRLVLDVFAEGADPDAPLRTDAPKAPARPPSDGTAGGAPAPAPAGSPEPRRRVVVVDAGHGGKDPGAVGGRGTREKDVNLAAAHELAAVLRERGDFEVVLTREDDTFVPLSDRSKKANDLDADLFVSLHCNSIKSKRERGFEVYSVSETASDPEAERIAEAENAALELEGKDPQEEAAKLILLAMTKTEMINESAPFAALVRRGVAKRVDIPDRGQKQAAFYVLRGTHAPAILVEMAFVSDPKDEAALGSRRFRRRMAEGVAAGIADYARKKGWLE